MSRIALAQGPAVHVPGQQMQHPSDLVPKQGYNAKHLVHSLIVEKMSKIAYKDIGELVSAECRLVHIPEKKSTRVVIGVSYSLSLDEVTHFNMP
jgi:hypothetical protein